jgi:hypothetical protein
MEGRKKIANLFCMSSLSAKRNRALGMDDDHDTTDTTLRRMDAESYRFGILLRILPSLHLRGVGRVVVVNLLWLGAVAPHHRALRRGVESNGTELPRSESAG